MCLSIDEASLLWGWPFLVLTLGMSLAPTGTALVPPLSGPNKKSHRRPLPSLHRYFGKSRNTDYHQSI